MDKRLISKKCPKCQLTKNIQEFNIRRKTDVSSWCRACTNENNVKYYQENKRRLNKLILERFKKDPLHHKARSVAWKHISLEGKKCEKCGSVEELHRHHFDYTKPLEVAVLCKKCHYAFHAVERRLKSKQLSNSSEVKE